MDNLNDNKDIFEDNNVTTEDILEEEVTDNNEDYDNESFFGGGDSTYVKKSDKYEDVRSSAFTMLIVGMIGIIFVILSITKVINLPFNPTTAWLFYGIMSAVFIAFVIGGLLSYRRTQKLKEEAEIEDKIIDEINTWSDENLNKNVIDLGLDLNETVEILYFSRSEKIKNLLMHEFEDVDEGLIDLLTENIYSKIYEDGNTTDED